MVKKNLFGILNDILIIILFILAIYFILMRVFGQLATDLTISITIFTLLSGIVLKLFDTTINLNREFGEFGEFKIKAISAFEKIREDLDEIKNKLKIKK